MSPTRCNYGEHSIEYKQDDKYSVVSYSTYIIMEFSTAMASLSVPSPETPITMAIKIREPI